MKKVVVLFVVFALCVSLTACGGKSGCDHQYEGIVTKEATCGEKGVKTFTCSACGDSYTEDVPTISHSFGEATVTKEATCTEEGEKKAACSVCGATDISESIPKIPHNYTEKVTKKATCTSEGEKTFTCSVCNDSYTETIAKAKHNYASKTTKEATCTAKGEKTYTCKNCNHSYTEEIKIKDHDYSSKTTKAATCTAKGEKVLTCKNCSHTRTESVAAKGHKWVDATCTKDGYCSVCKAAGDAAQGHDFGYGNCFNCGMSPLTLPEAPITITDYYSSGKVDTIVEITGIELVFDEYYSFRNESLWKITFIGTAVYNSDGNAVSSSMSFAYKLYDDEGFVVKSSTVYSDAICVGEKFKETISLYLEPGKTYRLELLDVS